MTIFAIMNVRNLKKSVVLALETYKVFIAFSRASISLTTSQENISVNKQELILDRLWNSLEVLFAVLRAVLLEVFCCLTCRKKTSDVFLILSPSRVVRENGFSVYDRLLLQLRHALSSQDASTPLIKACKSSATLFSSALYREINHLTKADLKFLFGYLNIFGIVILGLLSNFIYPALLLRFYAKCQEKGVKISFLEIFFISGLVLYFQFRGKPRSAVFLTSNSRLVDAFQCVLVTLNVPVVEYLHGIPDLHIASRLRLIYRKYNNFQVIPLLPGSLDHIEPSLFLNFRLGSVIHSYCSKHSNSTLSSNQLFASHSKILLNSNSKNKAVICYIGAYTAGYEEFFLSDVYANELIALEALSFLSRQYRYLHVVYCPHPLNKRFKDMFHDLAFNNITVETNTFSSIVNSCYCISLFSSAAFEAAFLGKKVALVHPGINQLFDHSLLANLTHIPLTRDPSFVANLKLFLDLGRA